MKRLLTFLMAASAAGAIAAPIAMAQDPRPGYGYGIVTCSTSSNGFQFQNSSRSSALSRNEILQQCSNDSRTSNDECSANVYCDDDFNPAPMIQCSTSSNGQQFQDESRNPLIARQHAMSACSNDSHTSNDECSANAACTNENPAPMVTCSTFSRGINFSDESRNPEVAKSHAVSACQNDSRTTNQECSVNVACNMPSSPYPQPQPQPYPGQPYPQPQPQPYPGQPYPQPANPVITCSTSSNGLNFENSSRDSNFSRQDAIRQCTGDSRTSNDECQANSICTDDYNPAPMIQCSTFSRGINFSDESRNPQIARSHAVSTCQSDSRTSNSECSVNVACFDPNPNPTYVPNPNPYPTYVPGPGHGPGPGPGPFPGPGGPGPGNPYPNPTLYTCTASTNQGQYIGTAPSPEQATAYARDNCLRAETSFRCNAASIVCRH